MLRLLPLVALTGLFAAVFPESPRVSAADDYTFGPDSMPQADVPKGKVTHFKWTTSEVFKGTERDCWLYVPAQYDGKTPACVMVFQDGSGYVHVEGEGYVRGMEKQRAQYRVPVVFDNLIHKKQMPVTVGIFINPGTFPADNLKGGRRSNRSFEYDSLSDQYAKFLEKEILPEVGKTVKLRTDAAGRAICGISSGGIRAFHRRVGSCPDMFSKVLSHVGSFHKTFAGGDVYPGLIRKIRRGRQIRVFLQDGTGDLDNLHGNWPLANFSMASSSVVDGVRLQTGLR